jgi:hypothetical protein
MELKVSCDQIHMLEDKSELWFAGVVRKQLGLTFLGETRDDIRLIMGDIRLHGVGLDRAVRPISTCSMKECS